jgi:hypothetical protein
VTCVRKLVFTRAPPAGEIQPSSKDYWVISGRPDQPINPEADRTGGQRRRHRSAVRPPDARTSHQSGGSSPSDSVAAAPLPSAASGGGSRPAIAKIAVGACDLHGPERHVRPGRQHHPRLTHCRIKQKNFWRVSKKILRVTNCGKRVEKRCGIARVALPHPVSSHGKRHVSG